MGPSWRPSLKKKGKERNQTPMKNHAVSSKNLRRFGHDQLQGTFTLCFAALELHCGKETGTWALLQAVPG